MLVSAYADAADYGVGSTGINLANASGKQVVISSDVTLNANATVANLVVINGAKISLGNYDLTITHSIVNDSGLACFVKTSSGSVQLPVNFPQSVNANWWGAGFASLTGTALSAQALSGTITITVNDSSKFIIGGGISIDGAGVGGKIYIGRLLTRVGNVLTLDSATSTTVAIGALCFGDDAVNIQDVINSFPTGAPGKIMTKITFGGIYYCRKAISVNRSYVTFDGIDSLSTMFYVFGDQDFVAFKQTTSVVINVTFQNLNVNISGANPISAFTSDASNVNNCVDLRFKMVWVNGNNPNAAGFSGALDINLQDTSVELIKYGVNIRGSARITNCLFWGLTFTPIKCAGTSDAGIPRKSNVIIADTVITIYTQLVGAPNAIELENCSASNISNVSIFKITDAFGGNSTLRYYAAIRLYLCDTIVATNITATDAIQSNSGASCLSVIVSNNITVSNFIIDNNVVTPDYGVYIQDSYNIEVNAQITNSGIGVYFVTGGVGTTIGNVSISGMYSGSVAELIKLDGYPASYNGVLLFNNMFSSNGNTGSAATSRITVGATGATLKFIGCNFLDTTYNYGINLAAGTTGNYAASNTMLRNTAINTGAGTWAAWTI